MRRTFLIWLAAALVGLGAVGGGYHFYLESNPKRILVVVDASYEMSDDWQDARRALKPYLDAPYAEFALATEKGPVHGWQPQPNLEKVRPYAPRDFEHLATEGPGPQAAEADEILFVTNAPDDALDTLPDWTVVRP